MSGFLNVSAREVFSKCAITNLVKCSTHGEQDLLRRQTIRECFTRHFCEELKFYSNVRVLIAFGKEVYKALTRPELQTKHGKRVIYLKHPSYHYRRELEERILANLKVEIAAYLS